MPFDNARIDIDALKVVRRLIRHGFEAYFVGGGVRDLLLGCRPKDFDIATDARPEQIRTLFRNSRIIGRRFRLVHVLFARSKVIEVATFRRNPELGSEPEGDDVLRPIRSDNLFGQAHEDAMRRDLTINALLYDVERREVLDFVGGMPDIERRLVRTIGDPVVRFREDPVRMIRAIKFSARLDLGIDPEVYDAIVLCREAILEVARPRLLEELLKVLRSGSARRATRLTWETSLLHALLPELATFLDDADGDQTQAHLVWRILGEIDRRTHERGGPLGDVVLLTSLFLAPMLESVHGSRDRAFAAHEFGETVFARLAVPRRISDAICRMVAAYPKLQSGRPGRFARTELHRVATEVLEIHQAALAAMRQ